MNKSEEYFEVTAKLLRRVADTQQNALEAVAQAVADALCAGGTVYAFGTGHSHILAEEIFYRAGGLVKVFPILDEPLMLHTGASRSSKMERLSGYAEKLINNHLGIRPGDVMFIFSNSGRNTVSVDMALEARKKGMKVICITNLRHAASVTSRHPSGEKLCDVCDIVLDNCGEIGDAAVTVGENVCGPTSTVIGAAMLQAIVCRSVEIMTENGITPEVFKSSNMDGGDEINEQFIEKYHHVIKIL